MMDKRATLFLIVVMAVLWGSAGPGASPGLQQAKEEQISAAPLQLPASFPGLWDDSAFGQTAATEGAGPEAGRSLFEGEPLGWSLDTIRFLYNWVLALPLRGPEILRSVVEGGRSLGAFGSILFGLLFSAILYCVIRIRGVAQEVEKELQPLWDRVPALSRPHLLSFQKIVSSAMPPLLLLGTSLLIERFTRYDLPWFHFINKLLGLWAAGALVMTFMRETLTDGLLRFCPRYGKELFRTLRLVLLYVLAGVAVVWGADAIQLPADVLAFLRFGVSLTVVCVLSSLFLKKDTLLTLLPQLPGRSYAVFAGFVDRAYSPLALLTFFTGLLWCFGYRRLSEAVWIKTWGVAGAYIAIVLSYHFLALRLERWSERKERRKDEAAQFFFRSAKGLLRYATVAAGALIILKMLGLLAPLHYVMALPVYTLGDTPLSFWVFIEAGFVMLAFVYVSRLLRAYLDYKIYPSVGVDTGLAYALNTFLRYCMLSVGFLSALRVIGLDLRVLMVFAGGVGIGTGLGLQNIAANILSGFIIVFGRKLRKGDWVKVENKLGMVTHIYLRATKIWTRDNIEFLVPNTDLVSKTIVNYTLTSPVVRIYIPMGVSYSADLSEVRRIMLESAEKLQTAKQFRKPEVRVAGLGDSSINLELLVWIDISKTAEKDIRSQLYFAIFEALNEAGIEIPSPIQDIRISTGDIRREELYRKNRTDSGSRQAVS